jgi:hypothetical protein
MVLLINRDAHAHTSDMNTSHTSPYSNLGQPNISHGQSRPAMWKAQPCAPLGHRDGVLRVCCLTSLRPPRIFGVDEAIMGTRLGVL